MSTPDTLSVEELGLIRELLETLSTLAKTHQIYGLDHPSTAKYVEQYQAECAAVVKMPSVPRRLVVAFHDGRFYLEHVPLPTTKKQGNLIEKHLAKNEMGGFELALDVRLDELEETLQALASSPKRPGEPLEESPTFRWIGGEQLNVLESASKTGTRRNHMLLELAELRVNESLYAGGIHALGQFMDDCFEGAVENTDAMEDIAKHLVTQFVGLEGGPQDNTGLMSMTTIPYHDNFTYYHSLNVTLLTLRAASQLTDCPQRLQRVGQAALLHDLGKIDVPNEVLYKAGRLTPEEAKLVMVHPVCGARRLSEFKQPDALAVRAAFGHHIKDNGEGYPKVSANYELDPVTKILEVCDIFEALTAFRPYKSAMTAAQAFEILYSMPNMDSFRPYIDLLVRALGFNPVGSRVRTADGELAIVVGHQDGDPRRPIFRTVQTDESGAPKLEEARIGNSIAAPENAQSDSAVVAVNPEEDLEVVV